MAGNPLEHQGFQPFPNLETPFVDQPSGRINFIWYKLLIRLWQLSGSNNTQLLNGIYLAIVSGNLVAFQPASGPGQAPIPVVTLGPVTPPGPPVPVAPTGSPQLYTASASGTLVVTRAQVELRRGASAFYMIGVQGGAVPMKTSDEVRMTWFGTSNPDITFFPG